MTQTHSPQTFNHPALELPFLEAKFSEFNERFFSNVIPVDHVVIKVVPKLPQGMIGAFVYSGRSPWTSIKLSEADLVGASEKVVLEVLLHEMVHCWSYYEPAALLQADEGAHHGVSFHLKRIAINCQQDRYHVTLNVGDPVVTGYDAVLNDQQLKVWLWPVTHFEKKIEFQRILNCEHV